MSEIDFTPPAGIVVSLVALQAAYLLCTGPYRDRFRGARPVSGAQQLLFAQGVVTLLLALASPLHALSDGYLFTAHMVQHLLVTLVAAPLLLAGTPGWLLEDLLRSARLLGVARWLLHPLLAFGIFNLVFALSHLPPVYELALANEAFHALEHGAFLGTALLLWLPILSPLPGRLPRYPDLGQVIYLAAQLVPASLVGALITYADRALYPTYDLAPRVVAALSPVVDQQLGGLLMWVGGSVYFLVATAIVFFAWAAREEAASRRPVGPVGTLQGSRS